MTADICMLFMFTVSVSLRLSQSYYIRFTYCLHELLMVVCSLVTKKNPAPALQRPRGLATSLWSPQNQVTRGAEFWTAMHNKNDNRKKLSGGTNRLKEIKKMVPGHSGEEGLIKMDPIERKLFCKRTYLFGSCKNT